MNAVASKVWTRLKYEPIAVWGVVVTAILGVLSIWVDPTTIATIFAVAQLLGIPVLRSKVSPVAALEALVKAGPPTLPASLPDPAESEPTADPTD